VTDFDSFKRSQSNLRAMAHQISGRAEMRDS
jgi:hypothetical protein